MTQERFLCNRYLSVSLVLTPFPFLFLSPGRTMAACCHHIRYIRKVLFLLFFACYLENLCVLRRACLFSCQHLPPKPAPLFWNSLSGFFPGSKKNESCIFPCNALIMSVICHHVLWVNGRNLSSYNMTTVAHLWLNMQSALFCQKNLGKLMFAIALFHVYFHQI